MQQSRAVVLSRCAKAVAAALLLAGLSACASPPEVTQSIKPTSEQDAVQLLHQCLLDRGWPVSIEGNAVTSETIDNEQLPIYLKDSEECSEQTNPQHELSSEEWTKLYTMQLDEARCLEKEFGYPYDPPSLQQYLDTAVTPEQWAPFAEMVNSGFPVPGGYADAAKKCPQPWL